jgi:hypothetical protein
MGRPKSEIRLTGNLRIQEDLKREIKITAIRRRMKEYQLVEEMWKLWQDRQKGTGQGLQNVVSREFTELTPEESSKLLAVLDFMRNPERVAAEFRSVLLTALESIQYLMGRAAQGEGAGQGEEEGQGEDPGPADESGEA